MSLAQGAANPLKRKHDSPASSPHRHADPHENGFESTSKDSNGVGHKAIGARQKKAAVPVLLARDTLEDDSDEDSAEEMEHESDDETHNSEASSSAQPGKRGRPRKKTDIDLPILEARRFTAPTSSDAYFLGQARISRTSSALLSATQAPMDDETYTHVLKQIVDSREQAIKENLHHEYHSQAQDWLLHLYSGFNILAYGLGSKISVLNAFAQKHLMKAGHVIVVYGDTPTLHISEVTNAIWSIVESVHKGKAGLNFGSDRSLELLGQILMRPIFSERPIFLLLHSLDAPSLRGSRSLNIISTLALHPHIHLIASIDHINAPLLFPVSLNHTRKRDPMAKMLNSQRGYNWAWYDVTTLAPYTYETSFRSSSTLVNSARSGPAARTLPTELAAKHVLAAVTDRAKKLFLVLARYQLSQPRSKSGTVVTTAPTPIVAWVSDLLYAQCNSEFIATSEAQYRALLVEYKDHSLIISSPNPPKDNDIQESHGRGEWLWIPIENEGLQRVVKSLATQIKE